MAQNTSNYILEATGLNKSFGAVTAAKDINISIERDAFVGLIGTNRAGKTTFINMVTGYLKPDAGTIVYDGLDITALQPRDITRMGICRSFQIPQLYNSLTVFENMMVGLGVVLHHAGRGGFFSRGEALVPGSEKPLHVVADEILARFDLSSYRGRPAQILPGGVRKLLDIAMTMVASPKILLLDEPTSGVSAEEKFGIMEMVMNAVKQAGATVLFVEHDMEVVSRFSQRVIAFYDGRVICDAPPDVALNDAEVQRYVIGGHRAQG